MSDALDAPNISRDPRGDCLGLLPRYFWHQRGAFARAPTGSKMAIAIINKRRFLFAALLDGDRAAGMEMAA